MAINQNTTEIEMIGQSCNCSCLGLENNREVIKPIVTGKERVLKSFLEKIDRESVRIIVIDPT